jgi:hypothetical protein
LAYCIYTCKYLFVFLFEGVGVLNPYMLGL